MKKLFKTLIFGLLISTFISCTKDLPTPSDPIRDKIEDARGDGNGDIM